MSQETFSSIGYICFSVLAILSTVLVVGFVLYAAFTAIMDWVRK